MNIRTDVSSTISGPGAQPETRKAERGTLDAQPATAETALPYHSLSVNGEGWGEVAKRRRGAPKGNTNARVHGYYSRKTIDACRRELEAATPYRGIDLDIVLALWQAVRIQVVVPGREALHEDAIERVFSLVRHKYGLRSRKDYETLLVLFLRLAHDLILQRDLCLKLEKAHILKADS